VRNGRTCNSKLLFYYSILHTCRYRASQGSRPNLVSCWERLGISLGRCAAAVGLKGESDGKCSSSFPLSYT
jgi:hypothetical protein